MEKSVEVYGNVTINKNPLKGIIDNFPIQLEYYKICSNKQENNAKPYGIGVIKTHTEDKEVNMEKVEFNNIFDYENEVDSMLNLLVRNQVTPIGLRDILKDFVLI